MVPSRALALAAALGLAPLSVGCANPPLALIGGVKVDAAVIDRDPIALLPAGIQALAVVDATAMFRTAWGAEAAALITQVLPIGPESNFSPQRDVSRVYAGFYAMQGADLCAVV